MAGKIKRAGKTTLITHLCRAVLDGVPFLDRPTERTRVVYLTEQGDTSFREALVRAGVADRDDFLLLSWFDAAAMPWEAVVGEAVAACQRHEAGLLVVDTLAQWVGLRGDGENDAGTALMALRPLQEAAARFGLAVVEIRHERKSGGDVGEAARGSSAFGGGVDILMSVRPAEGGNDRVRTIKALSRFDATPPSLTVELTASGYVVVGAGGAALRAEAALLAALPASAADAVPIDGLLATTGLGRTTAQQALDALVQQDAARRRGDGVRGDPFRYWAA